MLRGGCNQCQQQLQQQLALQRQCLMTHHNVQHLLQILAVHLQLATFFCKQGNSCLTMSNNTLQALLNIDPAVPVSITVS